MKREMHVKDNHRRVVVTGLGPVTPVGIGKDVYWESLIGGRSAFKRIEFPNRDMSQYRSQVAAPIEEFDLFQFVDRTKHSKYLGKTSRYALAAAALALRDAGIQVEKIEGGKESGLGGQYQLKGIDGKFPREVHQEPAGDLSLWPAQHIPKFLYIPCGPVFYPARDQLRRLHRLCLGHPCHDQ